MEELLDELIRLQNQKLLACAHRLIPHLTPDDLLQPNDFPELENNPYFRYEEGVLEGLYTARMALLAFKKDQESTE
ncbi:MAG: hypothetical protein ACM3JI_05200 [Anaerolineae bacterium]